jgi:sugar (pentulose or hexulose) kinase
MNLEWFLNNFCFEERQEAEHRGVSVYQILEEEAAEIPIGSGGVIFHPYLNTTGVAAPFRNAPHAPNSSGQSSAAAFTPGGL